MTISQVKTVERVKKWIFEHDCFNNMETHEFKQFEIREKHGAAWVYCVTGRKGDESSLFRENKRTRRKIAIGSRGGITAYSFIGHRIKAFRGWHKAMFNGFDRSWHLFSDID